jgi:small subunit ribosomal protein S1
MIIKFSLNFEKNNFVKLLTKYNYKFTIGDIFAGKVIGLEKSLYLIDIGTNILSSLPISEIFSFQSFDIKEIFDRNYIGEFILLEYNPDKNLAIISLNRLKSLIIWQRLKVFSEENLILLGQLEKSVGKGKIIRVEGFKGFIPNSHLPKYYRYKKLNLPLKFLSLNESKNKIFLSCKLAYFINQIKYINIKQVILGCITQVKSYGLFVNLYGLKGLVHISEVSSQKIDNLTKLFKKGQIINIRILYINLNRGRISLSLKIFN